MGAGQANFLFPFLNWTRCSELASLKLTANAPENGWLEYDLSFSFGAKGLFSGAFAVSFREGNIAVENGPFEVAFSIEHGDIPARCVRESRG